MKSKKKILRYLIGIDHKKSTPEFVAPKWRNEKIEVGNVKCYVNSSSLLINLSNSSRVMLDFVVHEMDSRNFIANDSIFKKNFNRFLKKNKSKPYKDNTINKCFIDLHKNNILIKGKTYDRGTYRVNPIYYSKVSENKRLEMLRKIKEAPFKDENNMIRRGLLSKG